MTTGRYFKREAVISVCGLVRTEGGEDRIELETGGVCCRNGDTRLILYEEKDPEGNGRIRNTVRICRGRADVRKRGSVNSDMAFEKGCRQKSLYRTPYGVLELEIDTKSLEFSDSETGMKLELVYCLGMNGAAVSENRLCLQARYS